VTALTCSEAVKTGVTVGTHLADALPCIQGDRVQLQQVSTPERFCSVWPE